MDTSTQERQRLNVRTNGGENGDQGDRFVRSAEAIVSNEEVERSLSVRIQSAIEEAVTTRQEVAEPQGWWDILAIGPIQVGAQAIPPAGFTDAPLLPHQVIRTGEEAIIVTVLIMNPFGPSVPSAADILSTFALPFEVQYKTGRYDSWTLGPSYLNVTQDGDLTPGLPFAVDILRFTANDPGCYEMNICARIFGCDKNPAPPFAGFARAVFDIDPDLLFPAPGLQFDHPVRFMVYE